MMVRMSTVTLHQSEVSMWSRDLSSTNHGSPDQVAEAVAAEAVPVEGDGVAGAQRADADNQRDVEHGAAEAFTLVLEKVPSEGS